MLRKWLLVGSGGEAGRAVPGMVGCTRPWKLSPENHCPFRASAWHWAGTQNLPPPFFPAFPQAHLLSGTTNMHQASVLRRFLRHLPLPGMPAPRTLHLQKSRSLPFPKGCALCVHGTLVRTLLRALVTFWFLFSLYKPFISF